MTSFREYRTRRARRPSTTPSPSSIQSAAIALDARFPDTTHKKGRGKRAFPMRFTLAAAAPVNGHAASGARYSTYGDFPEMSATLLEVSGWQGLVKAASARCFHVLEGEGRFVIAGIEYPARKGDIIMVPSNAPHDYTGRMKVMVVHSPAYHPDTVQSLE